jgi:hypothetical protein
MADEKFGQNGYAYENDGDGEQIRRTSVVDSINFEKNLDAK